MRSPLPPPVGRSRSVARRSGRGWTPAGTSSRVLGEILVELQRPSLTRVLNATGVIVHTNLGRAPLASAAREAVTRVAEGYSNLELELDTGARGSRNSHVAGLASRAHGRRGRDRRQQRRGGGAARGGGAGGPGPCDRRLPRPTGGDRRRVPHPRGDRPVGRDAGGSGHDQPDAGPRLRAGDRSIPDSGWRDPPRPPVELPVARLRRGGLDRAAVRTRRPGDRRRRLRASSPTRTGSLRCPRSRRCEGRSRRAPRLSAALATSCSAARRPGCCWDRFQRWRPRARIPSPVR